MFQFYVRPKLVHCSCVYHGLEARLCILPLVLNLLWRELFSDLSFFIGLLLSRAGPCLIMGFPLFSPLFAPTVILLPFLPCYSAISIVVLFDPCLLVLFLGLLHVLLSIGYNDPVWSLDLYSCYCGLS